ncbi:MAG TPA: site-2 protease family protein, partial [Ktedonobacter sp.]|nr:site-2 protease family protein [Ktedonobacter sp.]
MINVLLALMVIASFLLAIPLHECGHALMASWLGDKTSRSEGRLSLSLPAHIDPLGTLMCVILAFQPGLPVGLGWGKPIKTDPWKMRVGANAGVLLVALAGPIFSLLIGLLVALLVRLVPASLF